MIGPLEYRVVPAGGFWVVIADQVRLPTGEVVYNVHLETIGGYPYGPEGGIRVPPGPCYHRHPDAEIDRLIKLIDWPSAPRARS